jgi:ABC-type branched-subunit amino acid transport system substrate-binding protein
VYLVRLWAVDDASPAGRAFDTAYRARYRLLVGSQSDYSAAMGYTGMSVIADAIKRVGLNPTREAVRDALAATHNVKVIVGDGQYGFDADRMPVLGVRVEVVKGGKLSAVN